MELIKKEVEASPEKANRANFLELAKKDSKGIPQPHPSDNPIHIVKLLRGEEGTNKDFLGKEQEGVWLFFDENGIEKKYFVQKLVTDKNSEKYGKFNYLFEKFADIEEDQMLEMEYVKKGMKGYVDVRPSGVVPIVDVDDIPVIEDQEYGTH
jgi:hypothetical protein